VVYHSQIVMQCFLESSYSSDASVVTINGLINFHGSEIKR